MKKNMVNIILAVLVIVVVAAAVYFAKAPRLAPGAGTGATDSAAGGCINTAIEVEVCSPNVCSCVLNGQAVYFPASGDPGDPNADPPIPSTIDCSTYQPAGCSDNTVLNTPWVTLDPTCEAASYLLALLGDPPPCLTSPTTGELCVDLGTYPSQGTTSGPGGLGPFCCRKGTVRNCASQSEVKPK